VSIEIEEIGGVVFSKFDGEQTAAEVEAYIQKFSEVHGRGRPYVGINWIKRYARNSATTERMGRWMKDTEKVTRELCVAAAILNTSPSFRFILSAVFVIKPMVCPYQVCADFEHAEKFVRSEADKRRLVLPSKVVCPWPELSSR
jgi:hypothetical protein